jgi:hypothetical protein
MPRQFICIRAFVAASTSVMLAIGAAAAPAPRTLSVEIHCPKDGAHSACLRLRVFHQGKRPPSAAGVESWDMVRHVELRGSLGGAKPQTFRLRIENAAYHWGNAGDLGPVAYLGRSPRNRPVILTSAGPLEILSASFDVLRQPNLIIIDEPNWKMHAAYVAAEDVAWVVTSPDRIAAMALRTGACVSAPQLRPGLLQLRPRDCARVETTSSGLVEDDGISGDIDPQPDALISLIAEPPPTVFDRLLKFEVEGPDGPMIVIGVLRIRGTNLFVARLGYEDID